ncbi:hypothetical protein [Martelella radicis]|uniref:Glycosyltransferase RgtA/B/C/D-like domain-containing protein n=1 Tax=Martelella radicis TaxID=1397476 RepID=A0A7W6KLK0_9HYPH|nr:hypothetical protein [Martelella radicis]MBB4123300.1 hypothetical protein [Martelella radicis]
MDKGTIESKLMYWSFGAFILSFSLGIVHHSLFFPTFFDGDAAAMQVLASAIVDGKSILPSDFSYGNQIIILRSSPFIAFSLAIGLKGYTAFLIGSALSVAFWGVVLYNILNIHFKYPQKSILLTAVMLLPLGVFESNYILGQQSHLTNVILALGVVIFAKEYLHTFNRKYLILLSITVFLLSFESPIRGLLVMFPTFMAVFLFSKLRSAVSVFSTVCLSFVAAFFTNKILVQMKGVRVNYFETLTFRSVDEIISNIIKNSNETLNNLSSLNLFAGQKLSFFALVVISFSVLLLFSYFYCLLSGVARANQLAKLMLLAIPGGRFPSSIGSPDFVQLVGIFGVLVGAIAVATLNPDSSRHYLWAIFVLKLVIFDWFYNLFAHRIRRIPASLLLSSLAFVMSLWFALIVRDGVSVVHSVDRRLSDSSVSEIGRLSRELEIRNIYGEDFWRMMPLNAFVDDMHAQTLLLYDGEIRPYMWLSRPSVFCASDEVLYFLKNGEADEALKERLPSLGGQIIAAGDGYSIWKGQPAWKKLDDLDCEE